jgi:hypothetical protein
MNRSVPCIRFAARAVTRDLKLVFRAPMCFFEDLGCDGYKLSGVVLSIRNGDAIRLIHEYPWLWDFDAVTQISDGIGVGSVSAFMSMEGRAEHPARLPDNVGLPIICLRQQVIHTTDANAIVNPKQVFLDKQSPHSHAATYWPTMTLTHPSASGGASATLRRLGRLLPFAMAK